MLLCWMAPLLLSAALPQQLFAAERPRIRVEDYSIDATLSPQLHRLSARAVVKFAALDEVSIATFELHNALRISRITDEKGNVLTSERGLQDSSVRVALPATMTAGQEASLTFEYEGSLASLDDSPVPGLRLAYVGDPITVLLYAGRWFPVANYGIDRCTMHLKITAPEGYTVVSSGNAAAVDFAVDAAPSNAPAQAAPPASDKDIPKLQRGTHHRAAHATTGTKPESSAQKTQPESTPPQPQAAQPPAGMKSVSFAWSQPSFPGTVVSARFNETVVSEAGLDVHVFVLDDKKDSAQQFGETAVKELGYFTTLYGVPPSTQLKLVELPDDSLPAAWAPEMAGLAARYIGAKLNYRLLANAIAHQWFGGSVSPATRNEWWMQDGGARYSETRYIEYASGAAGAQEAVKEMEVGALAYDSVPLGQIGTLDSFDPIFQSMANDKGGMIFHMLRWVMGDEKFDKAMRTFFEKYSARPAGVRELEKVAEEIQGESLTWFFSEWLNSTGAPEFKNKYTVFRVQKGFRIVGQLQQDLDLFRMPVELKIDTDGKTETKTIDVVGTESSYTVETFGKPRKLTLDPDNHVLKNSDEIRLRSSIMRGQQMVQQGLLAESLKEFQQAIALNRNSSLAHYRIAEVYYLQHNYQAAANAYRDSLNGDGEPKWTEVWSHIQLGKIFDITGQRERALSEYRQALQTSDNTQGAMDEARAHLEKPFERPE